MCQSVDLSRKMAAQNAGFVLIYFCGGHKNNIRLCFWSSLNVKCFVMPVVH